MHGPPCEVPALSLKLHDFLCCGETNIYVSKQLVLFSVDQIPPQSLTFEVWCKSNRKSGGQDQSQSECP